MNESGMNPIGRGCSFINMDELLATVTIENELLNEGGCSSRLVHYSQLTIGKILHSIELPTRLNESHWMWESVPATECVALELANENKLQVGLKFISTTCRDLVDNVMLG